MIRASFRQLTTSTKIRRTTVTQQRAGRSLKSALKSAKAILDNEAATADQVKAALAQLNSAAEGLTKTQTPPKNDPQTPSTPSQGGSVQTGDTAHVALWLVLAGMSVIAYVAVRRKRA